MSDKLITKEELTQCAKIQEKINRRALELKKIALYLCEFEEVSDNQVFGCHIQDSIIKLPLKGFCFEDEYLNSSCNFSFEGLLDDDVFTREVKKRISDYKEALKKSVEKVREKEYQEYLRLKQKYENNLVN